MQYVVVERHGQGTYWHDPEPYLAATFLMSGAVPTGQLPVGSACATRGKPGGTGGWSRARLSGVGARMS